ncbi:MAG: hypothetical protein ABI543_11355 [Ignavibacteria bacterium]
MLLLIPAYFIIKRKSYFKKLSIIESVLVLVSILILLFPFKRGIEINELKATGKYIVDCINQNKIEKGVYPKDQNEIFLFCKNLNKNQLTDNIIRYIFIDAETTNEKNKNDKGYHIMKSSSFRLYLEPEFMKPDKMYFNESLNDFILTD